MAYQYPMKEIEKIAEICMKTYPKTALAIKMEKEKLLEQIESLQDNSYQNKRGEIRK